ncbi:hypothetical protein NONO_c37660 [Nocardia nova SH22a]|uniref:Uncharacterized protein n=1 Tax=Nocardia nova SH22a TaxID=1415166 RepID=W5TGR1_9NOCA|nr:hypothetical protein [Nocardia nova]AHH18550.1 hypothetical protein NONO_c37660 [Nocardia nova SH22a]
MPAPHQAADALADRVRDQRAGFDEHPKERLDYTRWDVSGRAVRLQDLAAALADHGFTVRRFIETLDGRTLTDERR